MHGDKPILECVDGFWCDGENGIEAMLKLFDEADLIVAYNGNAFDMPALQCHYEASESGRRRQALHLRKLFDPFVSICKFLGHRISLSTLSKHNKSCLSIESPKDVSGAIAVRMWHEGKRMELLEYCRRDVIILADLILKEDGLCIDSTIPQKRIPVEDTNVRHQLALRLVASMRSSYKRMNLSISNDASNSSRRRLI